MFNRCAEYLVNEYEIDAKTFRCSKDSLDEEEKYRIVTPQNGHKKDALISLSPGKIKFVTKNSSFTISPDSA